jgi:hypothetical protein
MLIGGFTSFQIAFQGMSGKIPHSVFDDRTIVRGIDFVRNPGSGNSRDSRILVDFGTVMAVQKLIDCRPAVH